MNFLKNVLATFVGIILFCMMSFFLLLIVGVVASAGGSSSSSKSTKNNSVIKLDLADVTNDYGGSVYIEEFDFRETNNDGLINVLQAIEYAKNDDKIKGISIENNSSSLGVTQRKAIMEQLEAFKKTGKFVVAYADYYSQGEYYLASVADTVYMNPMGSIDFKGLASEVLYMKDLQEKTGIHMEVIRHGKYKSAVEPFLQQTMSNENREQLTVLLNSIWESYVGDISKNRKISVETLNNVATNLNARNANLALENKLIDKIAYLDQYHNGIKKALGVKIDEEINEIDILDYIKDTHLSITKISAKDQIAVIFAQGEIQGGEGSVNTIGEKSINRALKEARTNDKIKAVVLRVNSPGGSALTSDIIWREIELTKKVKPVVVSMGDVAASGGYYIACNANRIFAEPGTITGSIGVFGMVPNFKKVADKFGVNAETVKTHENADGYSVFEEMSPKYRQTLTESIEIIYDTFISRVAAGRGIDKAKVDEMAQGRVWTGTMAKELGLVDELGSLDDAIAYAAKLVKTDDYKVKLYPEYEIELADLFRKFLGMSVSTAGQDAIKKEIGIENYELLQRMNYLKQSQGVQAMMPYHLNIK
ncbi:signal peptide peptidase SppA [Flavobacterium sp. CBA20B-1]|uniref:signal peptide peptidase SppA n=1 Tax=unclassified Flavobacterium TaxID=196869 RepID=UPI002224781F|nr:MULTISPECIES: signal peptide peptidase SppA [unclassified Flavobacterium]WCM42885.1 signal peptide peptidase SppA [Flavobacterium sp. CBA20B-1]